MRPAPTLGPDCFSLDEALRRERVAIWGAAATGAPVPEASALCLSGGGIRSAAFCLGMLQAFARGRLLPHFHYLSTVSGGGYIGSWLQAWLLEHAREQGRESVEPADVDGVAEALASGVAGPLVRLRDFTSYLTPEAGVASRDTWAAIVLYIRNVLINWAIFFPALFALALMPRVYSDILAAVPYQASLPVFLVALLSVGFAAYFTCARLPSHDAGTPPRYPGVAAVTNDSVAPAVIWAALLPIALAPFLIGRDLIFVCWGFGPAAIVPATTFVVLMAAYAAAWLRTRLSGQAAWMFGTSLGPWVIACAVAAVLLGGEIHLAAMLPPGMSGRAALLATFGPAALMLTHLSLSATFVALRVEVERSDLDREWLARLSAVKVVPMLLWAVLAAACLLLATAVQGPVFSKTWASVSAAVSAVSGVAGALLGKSANTSTTVRKLVPLDVLASLLTFVFAIGLMSLLSSVAAAVLDPVVAAGGRSLAAVAGLLGIVLSGLLAWGLGRRINVNRFSLHGVYRNRLVRAFLGSVRVPAGMAPHAVRRAVDAPTARRRMPDPFTDFDPADNLPLPALLPAEGRRRHLFPVIGTTLNLVEGAARAGQERKGAPFFITPAACGSPHLAPERRAFVATADYAGIERETAGTSKVTGMTLGTAMTLSGAAVSPNMGYHSSAWIAFLMTLFDVRLGGWLTNPAVGSAAALRRGKPPNALFALFREMLGMTDGTSPAIYLSDGGHFDNLGLYEMIRRRCMLVVAIDAGQDGEFQFADLAALVRLVRIDFNVEVEFKMPMPMGAEEKWSGTSQPYAMADIHYPRCDTAPAAIGQLLYVKPCRLPQMPVDVRGYAFQDEAFPADSTANQFFTESQFESYRRLGEFIGDLAVVDQKLSGFLTKLRDVPV